MDTLRSARCSVVDCPLFTVSSVSVQGLTSNQIDTIRKRLADNSQVSCFSSHGQCFSQAPPSVGRSVYPFLVYYGINMGNWSMLQEVYMQVLLEFPTLR